MQKVHDRPELTKRRKELRNKPTQAEEFLWGYIKNRQLDGRKFRRQHSIDRFVVDFYCPEERLVVELDEQVHFTEEGMKYDKERTKHIEKRFIKIIRFENQEVLYGIDNVLNEIRKHFKTK